MVQLASYNKAVTVLVSFRSKKILSRVSLSLELLSKPVNYLLGKAYLRLMKCGQLRKL